MLSDAAIVQKIRQQPKQVAGYKQLVRELGLHGDDRRKLFEHLGKLVLAGTLVKLDSDRYAIPKTAVHKNTIAGKLSLHRDGFGFVIPEPSPSNSKLGLNGDIFVPPREVGSAMHGDRVLVEITTVRFDGRAEGRILRTLERAHLTVVGLFHYGSRYNHVTPLDQKIAHEIVIPQGLESPAPTFSPAATTESPSSARDRVQGSMAEPSSPDRVLGKEAVRRQWSDLENVVVDVEITQWPIASQNPRGRVIEILGYEEDFGVDVEIIIRKYHLRHRFPPEVVKAARSIAPEISLAEVKRRRDFRALPIVTIDGESARDFDDAVFVRRLESGNFELQVHIADVAHYVEQESSIDQEARLRGTSLYFPDRAVPMLPIELSTDLCSLRPHLERLVISCVLEIDHGGEILTYEICPGIIRSEERMTYTAVNEILQGNSQQRAHYSTLVESFELMQELAMILNRKRERRGSVDFDLPEPVIEFDEFGLMKSIARSDRNLAHRIIEEFMLSANECVAGYLEEKAIPSLYRVHEKPDAKRVYDFEVIAASFGYSLGIGALPIRRVQPKTDRRASYRTGKRAREIEIPQEVQVTPRMYQKLAKKIVGKPEERILAYLMLRSLKQARYSEQNLGHFALAAPTYTHFTSPIRRYPDLIVHRILKQVLEQAPERWDHHVPVGTRRAQPLHGQIMDPRSSLDPWRADRPAQASAKSGSTPSSGHDRAAPQAPIALEELHAIAEESSQSERRADEAERELMEWKKAKFMQERLGEDFEGLIVSVTKYGFFVELTDLFVEGLVPLATLMDDRYRYHENSREIIGQHSRRTYRLGQRVHVLVDRIDAVEKKIQFAVLPTEKPRRVKRQKRA
ncbi:MAG: VacB/RNase II family 3'-5' exoribonuclease [Acidobacteria bacterium]|nr:VacB/RNase II family 3'-5' exoribonuclease [Acidobacteriota bacterium]